MKIIAGMHRSGTSLVARLAYEAGADMGDPSTFYHPDRWNPDGYFEQVEIHSINMPLINGPLWKFSYFFLPSEETIQRRSRVRSLAEMIRAADSNYRGKVVKENRFCLTLQAWLDQGTDVEKVVLVLRDPNEVARSLRRRNRIPLSKGRSLWLAHNRRLLDTINGQRIPVRIVRYDYLLDTETQCEEALGALNFLGINLRDTEVCDLIQGIAKPGLRHHLGEGDGGVHEGPTRELWEDLTRRHASQSRSSTIPFQPPNPDLQ